MNEQQELPISPEIEPKKEEKGGIAGALFDVLEMFAWSLFAVFIIFTFAVRLCNVEGSSMENTLYNGEKLLLSSVAYTPEQDDIVVFHLTDAENDLQKTLVKRVIATGGQHLEINFYTKEITVDGEKYDDAHAVFKSGGNEVEGYLPGHYTYDLEYNTQTGVLALDVPEGHLFVMGDNRNNSQDSRDADILFVDERCVLGKVILRLSPFTFFE